MEVLILKALGRGERQPHLEPVSASGERSGSSSLSNESAMAFSNRPRHKLKCTPGERVEWLGASPGNFCEGLGCFEAHETLRDSREKTRKGGVEIASAPEFTTKRNSNELTEFLSSSEAAMLQGVRETEVGNRESALAAVLEDEETQTSAVMRTIGRHRDLQLKGRFEFC